MVWADLEVELTGLPMCAVVCLVIKIRMSPEVLIFIFSVGQWRTSYPNQFAKRNYSSVEGEKYKICGICRLLGSAVLEIGYQAIQTKKARLLRAFLFFIVLIALFSIGINFLSNLLHGSIIEFYSWILFTK